MRNVYKISINGPRGSSIMRKHFFFVAWQPLVGQCLLIAEASWTHSVTHATLGSTPLDEWSACRRDLSTLKYTTLIRVRYPIPAGFELVIPASERPKTHAWYQAATGISDTELVEDIIKWILGKKSVRRYGEIN